MNLENFTTRSQEAIQLAFSLARDSQHQAVWERKISMFQRSIC
jgi:hypothetical protein